MRAAGRTVMLVASKAPASFLHFLLVPSAGLDRPVETGPAMVRDLYRSAAPLPHLRPGRYVLDLTRISFPTLDVAVGGEDKVLNVGEGLFTDKGPGSLVFEPYGLIHQWANPRGEPLTTVIFNLNPEGMGAVRLGAPAAGE